MTQLPPIIASFDNTYRVAVRLADATDEDQRIVSTGDPTRPFMIGSPRDLPAPCVALITAGI